jgi:hypothetical protein
MKVRHLATAGLIAGFFALAAPTMGAATITLTPPTLELPVGDGCGPNIGGYAQLNAQVRSITTYANIVPTQYVRLRAQYVRYLWNGSSWVGTVVAVTNWWQGIAIAGQYQIRAWQELSSPYRTSVTAPNQYNPTWGRSARLPAAGVIYRALVDVVYEQAPGITNANWTYFKTNSRQYLTHGCYYPPTATWPQSVW